jgi:hypothetical protein
MYGPAPQFNTGPRLAAPSDWHERGKKWASEGRERMRDHGNHLVRSLTQPGKDEDLFGIWLYFILKVLASVTTVFLFIVLLMVTTTTVTGDNSDSAVYLTNTFYTSNDNEQNISWQILTGSSWNGLPRPNNGLSYGNGLQFEHFYECMWVAQEGYGLCNGSASTVATYTTCLQSNYASQLATCAPQGGASNWPTSNQYSNCINNGLGNSVLWNLNAFRTCIKEDLWPLYDIPQDVTSAFFLGAYSWPLMVMTALFLFFVFALYTIWPVDWEDSTLIEQGKPKSSFTRLGMVWSGLAVLVALLWLIIVLLISFRTSSSWPNNNVNLYPSTQQTNVVMVVTTLIVVFYFLFDASEFQYQYGAAGYQRYTDEAEEKGRRGPQRDYEDYQEGDNPWAYSEKKAKIPTPFSMAQAQPAPGKPNAMGYYFPMDPQSFEVGSIQSAGRNFAPVLLKTWSDAYLLDSLFVVGVIGGTLQVFTADVFNIFWCILFYRAAHLGVARAGYFAYIYVFLLGESAPKAEAISATKVLALALHLAGLCALFVPLYIVFDNTRMINDYAIVVNTFIVCFIIPEIIRIIGHLALSVMSHESVKARGMYILIVVQFLWAWDLLVRCVLLWVLLWGNAGTRGTKPYLTGSLSTLNGVLAL